MKQAQTLIFLLFLSQNIVTQTNPNQTLHHNQKTAFLSYHQLPNNFEDDILLEMSLQHNFYFNYKKFLPKFWLEVNPEINIRMTDSSFTAQSVKFRIETKLYRSFSKNEKNRLVYLGFGHHSNGKHAPFINRETGEIDTENGDFATDYFQLGYVFEKMIGAKNNQFFLQNYYLEYHPGFYKNSRRRNLYKIFNEYRLGANWQIIFRKADQKNRFSISLKSQILFEDWKENNLKDKLIADLTFAWQPNFLKMPKFWLFLQGYSGEDYYQIYFFKKVRFLTAGISIRNW